jgi:LysM repeat protein
MKKITLALIIFFGSVVFVSAQSTQLIVKSSEKGLYLDHTIAPKEGLYAIGRLYNVNPKHIAAFNRMDLNKGLNMGDVIRIPLSDTNFIQKGSSGTPVYYIAGEKDGLMSVSNANKKVSLQQLREWNDLQGDKLSSGQKLVVGFLQSKEMPTVQLQKQPAKKAQEMQPVLVKTEEPKNETPPVVVKTEEPKKETPKTEIVAEKKEEIKQVLPEKKAEVITEAATREEPKMAAVKEEVGQNNGLGYFRSFYDQQVRSAPMSKNETVTSGIFKTTSGWQDEKYYLLIDKVSPGTIVKVMNPANNKTVYAKVLGEMNGIRQNQGLDIRISNAAASALGIGDPEKFIVKVNY